MKDYNHGSWNDFPLCSGTLPANKKLIKKLKKIIIIKKINHIILLKDLAAMLLF
jgi:hypothetical protein